MSDKTFRVMLDLFACSDPWPLSEEARHEYEQVLEAESSRRGYTGWLDAYHQHQPLGV
jgi:hypothetical protein